VITGGYLEGITQNCVKSPILGASSPYALFGTPKFEVNHLPNFILRKPEKKKNKTKQKLG
jgi:hypothetical protein